MIARFLLLLMLLAGAVTGMAAGTPCHDAPAGMATMPAMPPAHDHSAPMPEHRCLGCMPLPDAGPVRLPFVLARTPLPRPTAVRFAPRVAGPPAAPPPRIG